LRSEANGGLECIPSGFRLRFAEFVQGFVELLLHSSLIAEEQAHPGAFRRVYEEVRHGFRWIRVRIFLAVRIDSVVVEGGFHSFEPLHPPSGGYDAVG